MPVDTSMYNTAQPQQPQNPLAMLGQVTGIQNALQQNQLTGQTLQMRQGLADAYARATDANGKTNFNQLLGQSAQDPRTGWNQGDIIAQAQGNIKATSEADLAKLQNIIGHAKAVDEISAGIMKDPGFGTEDLSSKITSSLFDLVTHNSSLASPQSAANLVKEIPKDPKEQAIWVTNKANEALALGGQAQAILGNPQVLDNGPNLSIARTPAMGGATSLVGTIPKGMSPGEAATPIPGPIVNNQPTFMTKQGFANQAGAGAGRTAAGAAGPGMSAPAGAVAPSARGLVPTGAALGQESAANVTGQQSAQQGVALQTSADSVPQRKALLGNMDSALDQFTSGPKADWTKLGAAFVNKYNPFFDTFKPQSIASQEEFTKQATQLAMSQFQSLGGTGTDDKLNAAFHSNPNELLSKLGNKQIIQMLKGNEDAIAVKNREWQAWQKQGRGPETYPQFSAQFNQTFDPRVFQSVYMTPEHKKEMLSGLDPSEHGAFRNSYNLAVKNGWIPDPRGK